MVFFADLILLFGKNLGTILFETNQNWQVTLASTNWSDLSLDRINDTFPCFKPFTKYLSKLMKDGSPWDFRNAIASQRKQPTLTFAYYLAPDAVVNKALFNSFLYLVYL